MRNSFVRHIVVAILFVSLTLAVAPTASAVPARDSSESGFRDAIVRIVRVVRDAAKKTAVRLTSNNNDDGLATPRP